MKYIIFLLLLTLVACQVETVDRECNISSECDDSNNYTLDYCDDYTCTHRNKTCVEMLGNTCKSYEICDIEEVISECCIGKCEDKCTIMDCNNNETCLYGECSLKTCNEMNGIICSFTESCSTANINAKDELCCLGECKDESEGYLIKENIGNHKYIDSKLAQPPIVFSEQFKKGYMAEYDTAKVYVLEYYGFGNLNRDIEEYFHALNKTDIAWYGDNEIIGSKNDTAYTFIWASGARVIYIEAPDFFYSEYLEAYPSSMETTIWCSDTDGGDNVDKGGRVRYLTNRYVYRDFTDSCDSFNVIKEGYCEGRELESYEYTCDKQCIDNEDQPAVCGNLIFIPEIDSVNIRKDSDDDIYVKVVVEEEFDAECEIRLIKTDYNTTRLNWTSMSKDEDIYRKSITSYIRANRNYTIDARCFNDAGYSEIESEEYIFREG
jgi:hypothetical protein